MAKTQAKASNASEEVQIVEGAQVPEMIVEDSVNKPALGVAPVTTYELNGMKIEDY